MYLILQKKIKIRKEKLIKYLTILLLIQQFKLLLTSLNFSPYFLKYLLVKHKTMTPTCHSYSL